VKKEYINGWNINSIGNALALFGALTIINSMIIFFLILEVLRG